MGTHTTAKKNIDHASDDDDDDDDILVLVSCLFFFSMMGLYWLKSELLLCPRLFFAQSLLYYTFIYINICFIGQPSSHLFRLVNSELRLSLYGRPLVTDQSKAFCQYKR